MSPGALITRWTDYKFAMRLRGKSLETSLLKTEDNFDYDFYWNQENW